MHKTQAKKLREKVKQDYNTISKEFDRTRHYDWEEFKDFLPFINDGDKLADLGCGNGRFLSFIKKNKKVKYTGIDNSQGLLEKAQKNHPDAKLIYGDLLELPLKDQEMDIAVSIAVIHHIPSKKLREKALQEVRRILKPNGIFIVTAWNLFQPKYKKQVWKARIKSIITLGKYDMRDTFIPWGKTGVNRYYYAFKEKELQELLIKNNFQIIEKQHHRNFVFICKKLPK